MRAETLTLIPALLLFALGNEFPRKLEALTEVLMANQETGVNRF